MELPGRSGLALLRTLQSSFLTMMSGRDDRVRPTPRKHIGDEIEHMVADILIAGHYGILFAIAAAVRLMPAHAPRIPVRGGFHRHSEG